MAVIFDGVLGAIRTKDSVGNIDALSYKGQINLSGDFPDPGLVQAGDTYSIGSAVTDNDPTKTDTGQSFTQGDYIVWDGTIWNKTTKVVNWGQIAGNIVDQGDLQAVLDTKLDDLVGFDTDDLSEGTNNLYLTGDEFNKVLDSSDDINEGATNLFMSSSEKDKLANLTNYFKGYYINETDLLDNYPIGNTGEYVLVGSGTGDGFYYWDSENTQWVDTGSSSSGDMLKSIYDPTNVNADAFDMSNMVESGTEKIMTDLERAQIQDNTTNIDLKADKSNVLELDNTDTYTPNDAYQPATKKYVDDNIVAGGTYTNLNPTPETLGGIDSGSTFDGASIADMFNNLLYPYQAPSFNSFSISGQSTTIEVGTTISGVNTFNWSISNSVNIQENTISITDTTGSTVLASGLADDGTEDLDLGTVVNDSDTTNTWTIEADNTEGGSFNRNFNVSWKWRRYYGESANAGPLNETEIEALRVDGLVSGFSGTYSFLGGGYKYIAYPTTFGTATTFKDASTNLDVPFDAPYIVSITNANGVVQDYNIHRTTNELGSDIDIIVN